jgi:hypothetical protein
MLDMAVPPRLSVGTDGLKGRTSSDGCVSDGIDCRTSIIRCAGSLRICAEGRDETATIIWFAPHSAHGRPGFHDPALIGV